MENYIHCSKYARWNGIRRETYEESVNRYIEFMLKQQPILCNYEKEIRYNMENKFVCPSMRAFATAGKALELHNIAAYNCAYTTIERIDDFAEILYILMHGSGVGFSIEKQYISKLPSVIPLNEKNISDPIVFGDSKEGWYDGLLGVLKCYFSGTNPIMDLTQIRKKGEILKTFGGHASGPEPLHMLNTKLKELFTNIKKERQLTSIECLDLICYISQAVIVGGKRRSALIALTDLNDTNMLSAKSNNWYVNNSQRAFVNISAVYTSKPSYEEFKKEWNNLKTSGSGERGIFNRYSINTIAYRDTRDILHIFGANPCCEIILRPKQMCNLTEVILRENDTKDDIKNKIRVAVILGTYQSTFTNFKTISNKWKENCEEERLLGVSLTGIQDCKLLNFNAYKHNKQEFCNLLDELRIYAREVNKQIAKVLNINPSKAITCVKPSGTVSQLVNSSSGIHPRHSKYYMRSVRNNNIDPLTDFMKDVGIPNEPEIYNPNNISVFYFPIKSPEGCITTDDISAIDMLEFCTAFQKHWCEHKVSATVNIKDDNEWNEVFEWVYKNFNDVSGITFFQKDNNIYPQLPYTTITKEEYETTIKKFPTNIDWTGLEFYEHDDRTTSGHEYACVGNSCDKL